MKKMTSLRGDYGWVSDNAGVVESRDQQTIDETIDGLYKRYGTEIAVVTLQALPTRNSEEYRAFATRLFNAWGVGNAARDTGVLLLLVRDNRRFEVVTGSGLSTVVPSAWLYDFQTRELEAPLVGGDYSKALAKTVVAIAEKIEEHESNWRSNQAKAAKKEVVPQEQRSVFAMLGQLGVLLSLFAGYLYWSWREEDKADETHKCSFCGGEVERDTSRILSYTDAQALEVALGAATYEAGKCSGCRRTQNIRRLAFRRGAVQRCDYCRNHTAIESESFVVDEKAQKRTRVLRKDCQYQACAKSSFTEEPVAFISSISEDSSSAPSGFGGGSTSGGGSGRSF